MIDENHDSLSKFVKQKKRNKTKVLPADTLDKDPEIEFENNEYDRALGMAEESKRNLVSENAKLIKRAVIDSDNSDSFPPEGEELYQVISLIQSEKY